MATSKFNLLPKSTAEIEITIPWNEISDVYNKKVGDIAKDAELPGFRKGKAPKKMVEEKIDKTKVYEEVIKTVIPQAYAKAVKENNLMPVSSPKIEILKAKDNIDWVVKVSVALKPKINLKNYKDKIRQLKTSKTKIWTPGSGTPPDQKEQPKVSLDEIVNALAETAEMEMSDLLITEEANRLLSNLIDQTQKLGMTIEQYMLAKNKTSEQLRAEYALQASRNLKIEFALSEIADQEKIMVTQEDLDKLIAKAEKPEDREKLKKDSYYLAHLIRQQKTLDFLSNL